MSKPWIGYVRLSTEEQADTNALRNQIERLKEAGAVEVFYDIESGEKADRENLKKVLGLVVNKEVGGVLSTRWDRLMRSYEIYLQIKEIFRKSGVQLRLLDQGDVDLETSSGELNADLQAVFSVHELRSLRERVKKGFRKRRDRNAAWSRAPWGYIIIDEKYVPDYIQMPWCGLGHRPINYRELYDMPDLSPSLVHISKAQIAREVFDLVLETRSPSKALNYLREKYNLQRGSEFIPLELQDFPISDTGFKQWLKNPIFCGHTAYNKFSSGHDRGRKSQEEWDVRRNTHEAILSEDEGQEIQEILSANYKKHTPSKTRSYLTKLVFCEKCHSPCSLKTGGRWKYYGCQHSVKTCSNRGCVNLRDIEQSIIQAITRKAWQIAENGAYGKSDALIQLEEKYQKLLALGDLDSVPSLRKAKEELEHQIEIETNREDWIAKRMLMQPQAQKINFWYTLTQEERRIFYGKLVSRVVIGDRTVTSVVLKV